tara:strand:- start:1006 stop:1497 length:492 start_codon:yes stop_codon:yes gene_type:complete
MRDMVWKVNDYNTPLYYRRRTRSLAQDDLVNYSDKIWRQNMHQETWNSEQMCSVRVKRFGRRIIFTKDEAWAYARWKKYRDKLTTSDRIRRDKNQRLFKYREDATKKLKYKEKLLKDARLTIADLEDMFGTFNESDPQSVTDWAMRGTAMRGTLERIENERDE